MYVFEQKYEKYQKVLSENFPFLVLKFSIYLNGHVFLMSYGPDQYVYLYSLVGNFTVHQYILRYPLILQVCIEGPDQITFFCRLIWAFAAHIWNSVFCFTYHLIKHAFAKFIMHLPVVPAIKGSNVLGWNSSQEYVVVFPNIKSFSCQDLIALDKWNI